MEGELEPLFFMFFLIMLMVSGLILLFYLGGWWLMNREGNRSPYTKSKMRRGEELTFYACERIYSFLQEIENSDNPIFDINKASFCEKTGRIFPDTVNARDIITVGWSFLNHKHHGNWVSWGSLTKEQQDAILLHHDTVAGFQIVKSSSWSSPKKVEMEYILEKPGPLYVDKGTKTLMGWKNVPGTSLEVLVVQRKKYY